VTQNLRASLVAEKIRQVGTNRDVPAEMAGLWNGEDDAKTTPSYRLHSPQGAMRYRNEID
jgi:hypothetical protein